MPTPFDQLKSFSFNNIPFPYQRFSVSGGLRDHVHEYPHTAGGAPEKLGRKLYEIQVTANFQAALWTKKYANLWPNDLGVLRALFEDQTTSDLHIPTIGTIKAYAVSWNEIATAQNRSGVEVELTFREDQESAFLVAGVLQLGTGAMKSKVEEFENLAAQTVPGKPSIFDTIIDAANFVLSFKDQFDLYGSLLESKILSLVSLMNEADRQLKELDDPTNYAVLDAFQDLWLSVLQLQRDIRERGESFRFFTTPMTMALQDVSSRIYGDASRSAELLQLNALEDPFDIPANTVIRYYDVAA